MKIYKNSCIYVEELDLGHIYKLPFEFSSLYFKLCTKWANFTFSYTSGNDVIGNYREFEDGGGGKPTPPKFLIFVLRR